jgi:hypothetical protein
MANMTLEKDFWQRSNDPLQAKQVPTKKRRKAKLMLRRLYSKTVFPGAVNSSFTSTLQFKAHHDPIPTYRVMDPDGKTTLDDPKVDPDLFID